MSAMFLLLDEVLNPVNPVMLIYLSKNVKILRCAELQRIFLSILPPLPSKNVLEMGKKCYQKKPNLCFSMF